MSIETDVNNVYSQV